MKKHDEKPPLKILKEEKHGKIEQNSRPYPCMLFTFNI